MKILNWARTGFNKLSRWYFTKEALPYWCVLLIDCFIVVASLLLAYAISYGADTAFHHLYGLTQALLAYLICYLIAFRVFHTYVGVVRYSSFTDLYHITAAMVLGSTLVLCVRMFMHTDMYLDVIGRRALLVGTLIAIITMWFVRMIVKVAYDTCFVKEEATHVMIYGTKQGGVSLAKSIRNQHPSPYVVEGFITRNDKLVGHTLVSVPVFSAEGEDLWRFIEKRGVKALLVSPLVQDHFLNKQQGMIDRLVKTGIHIMMMPPEQEWDGKSDLSHTLLREVSVEDLMPREKIEVDLDAIGEMMKDKRILITGAAGSIGSEIVRQVAKFAPEEMILIDQAETPMHDMRLLMNNQYAYIKAETIVGSITNATQMEDIFKHHRPDYVFHAAAYKHVPMMEDNPAMAIQNNVYGTRVIADLAVKYGTKKFVMISTDKAVNPTNVMGCSKRICEIYCQSLNKEIEEGKVTMDGGEKAVTQFVTTRFGNVLGSNGSVIPIFKNQIMKGGPVTVTHPDIIRFFMLIPEACRLVLEAGTMGHGGEIFVFDMGEPVRIADLAQRMIDMMGAKDVKIQFTGLRDGEKLYEEVLSDDEQTKPTQHPKIKVATVREYPYAEALQNEKELHELSFGYDDMAIVKKMKEIVPEYKSKQSKYEVLDK
ncbi:MAG: polysaccharide biosynthesis protein [Bacteroidaceae bacterium]|nr:polysaccharide biosynthesis protein [Bacteroidaceae bacterium]